MGVKRALPPRKATDAWIQIEPVLLNSVPARRVFTRVFRQLGSPEKSPGKPVDVGSIRDSGVVEARKLSATWASDAVLVVNVLCDLREQAWRFRKVGSVFAVRPPTQRRRSVSQEKDRIRAAHLIARDTQLQQPSVRKFVRQMERRHLYGGEWHSIFSLMRDGRQLSALAAECAAVPSLDRSNALKHLIDPYVQVAASDAICEHTGLRLSDVWRYFRHTWTTEYQSTPGRKMWFLVRDRAAPNHPVIGIGALGSAIVQLSVRDEWIGWTGPRLIAAMREAPTASWARWLARSLDDLIDGVHWSDFVRLGELTRAELRDPTHETVQRLLEITKRERAWHRLFPSHGRHKKTKGDVSAAKWRAQAETHLFRSKRAKALAELLDARRRLLEAGFTLPTASNLKKVLNNAEASRAITLVVRRVKAANVGIDMMDVTVCGAIAPYNHLIGGKLVSLLMASPGVTAAYNRRYRKAISIIASSVAGHVVSRPPRLVLLGTTGLYGIGSSQYNRIRMPADVAGGESGTFVEFRELGVTAGYGSYHFSAATMKAMELVLRRQQRGRPVNSIFGEGVNPKFRKVRGGLDAVGLPADLLLQHGSARVVYAVALASNFRDVLMGRSKTPRYILPANAEATDQIAEYWRERWLNHRIENADVLNDIARHSLAYPIDHGARVRLPELDAEQGTLFEEMGARHEVAAMTESRRRSPRAKRPVSVGNRSSGAESAISG